jgi:hypothetical protein
LAPGVRDKLMPLFENARKEENFGNGRFARNTFEKARLRQANRLLLQDINAIRKEDVMTLYADDFDMTGGTTIAQSQRVIGFGS